MRLFFFPAISLLLCLPVRAQDTLFAREVIKYLTSKKCYGRGYIENGLQNAEKYIVKELKKQKTTPLFEKSFTQPFHHNVNTFPSKCDVKINGKSLKPGIDFILEPTSSSAKGKLPLIRSDSSTFIHIAGEPKVYVILKDKLTFSVGKTAANFCGIEIDRKKFSEEPKEIEVDIENKLVSDFESKNIGCFINGNSNSDSMIVYSAHYDHLGGIGKTAFFPGANDNASGVSVVLNLIRYYKSHPPKYKTVFIFFAGEEAGLVGSKYFVGSNVLDLKKIKFLVNLDLLGTGNDGIMIVNGAIHEKEFNTLTKLNSEKNFVKEIKKRGKASNSDHYWFSEAGVPCFFIYTLGGTTSYHDVYDIEKKLPLTDYVDVFKLVTEFIDRF